MTVDPIDEALPVCVLVHLLCRSFDGQPHGPKEDRELNAGSLIESGRLPVLCCTDLLGNSSFPELPERFSRLSPPCFVDELSVSKDGIHEDI